MTTGASEHTEHARAAEYAARNFRWNATLLVGEAVSFFAGIACFDSTTVLPVLLRQLHASDSVIGLTRFIGMLGFTLPALFAAHYIHGRANHKSFLLATCAIGRSGLLTVPVALLLFGTARPTVALVWTLIAISVFWLLDGACAVSWFDIIAKTIHARVRGRFFGVMQMMGGTAALLSGLLVSRILGMHGPPFPLNFAVLALVWCAGAGLSLLLLALLREPWGTVGDEEPKPTFVEFVRAAPALLRRNPRLGRLIAIRVLLDGAAVAGPFYVVFARDSLHVPLGMVGVYVVVQNVGRLATGPLWGWVTDHFGTHVGLRAVSLAVLVSPLLALAAHGGAAWALLGVFFLLGSVGDGVWMIGSSALLEAVTAEERPFAVGVATVFQTPSALYGLLGGFLAQYCSYPVVFGVAAGFTASGLALACRLPRFQAGGSEA